MKLQETLDLIQIQ